MNTTLSRSEFWEIMKTFILSIIAALFITMLIAQAFSVIPNTVSPIQTFYMIMTIMFAMIILFSLPCTGKRLNDMGKSRWWQLLYFTGIGIIPILYWLTRPTKLKNNRYRPNEKTKK